MLFYPWRLCVHNLTQVHSDLQRNTGGGRRCGRGDCVTGASGPLPWRDHSSGSTAPLSPLHSAANTGELLDSRKWDGVFNLKYLKFGQDTIIVTESTKDFTVFRLRLDPGAKFHAGSVLQIYLQLTVDQVRTFSNRRSRVSMATFLSAASLSFTACLFSFNSASQSSLWAFTCRQWTKPSVTTW